MVHTSNSNSVELVEFYTDCLHTWSILSWSKGKPLDIDLFEEFWAKDWIPFFSPSRKY